MGRIKKILKAVFDVNAADSEAEKEINKHAARYGLDVTGASNSTGTGWSAGLEHKDIEEAVTDINDGLAKSGAKFRVKGLPAPKH